MTGRGGQDAGGDLQGDSLLSDQSSDWSGHGVMTFKSDIIQPSFNVVYYKRFDTLCISSMFSVLGRYMYH